MQVPVKSQNGLFFPLRLGLMFFITVTLFGLFRQLLAIWFLVPLTIIGTTDILSLTRLPFLCHCTAL